MNGRTVRLRLIRRRGNKVEREWAAAIRPDDRDALADELLVGAQLATGLPAAAIRFADYRLEIFAIVGGWTRVKVGRR